MIDIGVPAASVVLHLIAAGLAFRLTRVAGWRPAWAFVSAALVFMSLPRGVALTRAIAGDPLISPDLTVELVALTASALMAAGLALVGPLFARAVRLKRDLWQSEQRLRAVVENAPFNIALKDREGRHILTGPRSKAVWGVSREEVTGKTSHEFVAKELADALVAHDREVLETGRAGEWEDEVSLEDGVHTVSTVEFPIPDSAGGSSGVGMISLDITERKNTEQALRESEERFGSLVKNIAGAVYRCAWDKDWATEFMSDAIEDISGYPASDFVRNGVRTYASIIHPDDRAMVEETVLSAVNSNRPFTVEYRVLTAEGKSRWVWEKGVGVCDDGGKVLFLDGTIFDITERKRAEEEIRRLNTFLTRRVEEGTTELHATRDALLRNEHLAALGQLTGTVAHELRNPLGAIATSFDVIQNKCQAAKLDLDRALGRAKRNIKRCDGLIGELLDFTRVKGLRPEPTVVDAWLSEILEDQHIPGNISVNRDLCAVGTTVAFDREQVRRAVINVMDNACQAMEIDESRHDADKKKELTVATRRTAGRIEIKVADTGSGIPADDLPKVVEPLFSTKSSGTGLGLTIVQRIMDRHGGGLEITSEECGGTQVLLWLPLHHGQERELRG